MKKSSNSKKTITICSSASFYRDVIEIERELRNIGFKVKVPETAIKMKKAYDYDVKHYKIWFGDKSQYKKKTILMKNHFKKVIDSDAILMINKEKNGMKGYIGGNGLMEMTIAFHYKKPIFIYEKISDDSPISEEIYGLNSIFIDKDLTAITKNLT